jgi:hypothetical protein
MPNKEKSMVTPNWKNIGFLEKLSCNFFSLVFMLSRKVLRLLSLLSVLCISYFHSFRYCSFPVQRQYKRRHFSTLSRMQTNNDSNNIVITEEKRIKTSIQIQQSGSIMENHVLATQQVLATSPKFVASQTQGSEDEEDTVSIKSNSYQYNQYLLALKQLNFMNPHEKSIVYRKINRRNNKVLRDIQNLPNYYQILILLCGIPGSGKSTFAQRITTGYHNIVTCNNDPQTILPTELKFLREFAHYTQDQFNSRKQMENYCYDVLMKGYSLIVDRCNFDEPQRSHWIRMLNSVYSVDQTRQPGAANTLPPPPFYILSILVPNYDNVPVCSERAYQRGNDGLHDENTDWKMVCNRMLNDFRYPTRREGIHGVFHCKNDQDAQKIINCLLVSQAAAAITEPVSSSTLPS